MLEGCYLVSVPIVGCGVDSLSLIAFQELLSVPDTHGASHNLPDVGHQNIHLTNTNTLISISDSQYQLRLILSMTGNSAHSETP